MLRRAAVRGAVLTSGASLAALALQFVQLAVLARLLSPSEFGLAALVTVVVTMAQAYADLGMSGAIVHRQDAGAEQLSSVYWLSAAAGAVIALLVWIAAPLLASAFGEPRLEVLVRLAALILLVAPLGQPFQMMLQRDLRFGVLALADVLGALVALVVSTALVLAGAGVAGLVWGQVASAALRAALFAAAQWRRWRPERRFRRDHLAGFVSFGAYQLGERTINVLGYNLDKLLLGGLAGSAALGLYNVAYQLVMRPLQVVSPVVQRVAFPVFARVQGDDARLREGYLEATRAVSLLLFPFSALAAALADPLVSVLLGPAWEQSVAPVRWLALLALFYAIGNPIGSLLLAKGRVRLGFGMNVWMIVLYASAIVLGAGGGAEGVARALVVATAAGLFPLGFWVRWSLVRMTPLPYLAALAPAAVAAALAALVMALLDQRMATEHGAVRLAAGALAGAATYAVAAGPWLWRFVQRTLRAAG